MLTLVFSPPRQPPRLVAEPEAAWSANGHLRVGLALLGSLNWGGPAVPLAAFTLALATVALIRLILGTKNRTYTRMEAPMDIDDSENHSELPFPGKVVDGEQTIQHFNM